MTAIDIASRPIRPAGRTAARPALAHPAFGRPAIGRTPILMGAFVTALLLAMPGILLAGW